MGKRLIVQRRGRGGSVFICPSWKRVGKVRYPSYSPEFEKKILKGKVVELMHDPGRGVPVAKVKLEDGREILMLPPEGIAVGGTIYYGATAPQELGTITCLGNIAEGSLVCNVELRPGDGGKIARSSGSYAIVLSKVGDRVLIQLPSGKVKEVYSRCRATIGIVAGGGRIEKPFLKAGRVYHLSRSKAWKYPTVRGKAMNAYAHPHGGGSHKSRRTGSTPVPRTAPPGQKVGFIAARRTGRRKGRKRR
ncbi:MAG: 50S ribosomal protein L2 [Thermoprotei archaeon]|mgnify:CR=1 FL=1|nr:MAG: 50S ribosomal protein L2 [Thermoprotei archaeon]